MGIFENSTDVNVRICFERVTPESAKMGDFSEYGELICTMKNFRELVELFRGKEISDSSLLGIGIESLARVWTTDIDPETNYRTGEETRLSYHLMNTDDNPASEKQKRRWGTALIMAQKLDKEESEKRLDTYGGK